VHLSQLWIHRIKMARLKIRFAYLTVRVWIFRTKKFILNVIANEGVVLNDTLGELLGLIFNWFLASWNFSRGDTTAMKQFHKKARVFLKNWRWRQLKLKRNKLKKGNYRRWF
jgi:hypothetical protein